MGVVELFSSYPSTSLVKSSVDCSHRLGGFSFDKKKWRVNCMASTILVEGIKEEEAQQRLSGVSFIHSHLLKLSPYQPILPFEVLSAHLGRKPEEIVKLDANENPYGPPPEVFEALASNKFPYVYPDPETRTLRAVLSEDSGLESEYILAGCGADELIDLIMRVLDPGDKIVDCPPTFTMYEFDAPVIGGVVIRSKLFQEHLTSPSNPDGSIISDEDLLKILGLPILVVLDEAYIEFSGLESKMQWVKKHENLIVLRTFSKRAGLAGLGVGYGAFPLSIIEYLWRAKQPHNVSVAADVSACAALKNGEYLEVGFSTFKPTSSRFRFRFCRVFSNDPYKNWVKHSIYKKASFKCLCLPSGIEFVPKESKKDEETSVVTVEEETEFSKTWKAFQGLLWKKVSQLDHIPERYERNAQVMFWVVAGSGVALATFFSVFYVAACKNCVENMMNSGKLHPLVCPPTATVEILKKTEKKQLGEIADKKLHERISVRKF